jgi:hypothetical protein
MAGDWNATKAKPRTGRSQGVEPAIIGEARRNIWLKIPVSEEMIAFLRYMNDEGGYFGIRDVLNGLFNGAFMAAYSDLEAKLDSEEGRSMTDFLKDAGYLRKDWTDPLDEGNG